MTFFRSSAFALAFALIAMLEPALGEEAAPTPLATAAVPASEAAAPAEAAVEPAPKPSVADFVVAERPEALRGVKRVAITTFSVEYMTFLEAKVEGNWGNLIGNKPNDVSVQMVGHDPTGWQAVVDAFYDRLVADLTAAGIEVVPQEELRAAKEYAAVAKAATELPKEVSGRAGKGTYYGARDLPVLIQDEVQIFRQGFKFGGRAPEDLYMGVGTKIAAGFATAGVMNAERALAKKLDAHVLKVRMTVLPTQVSRDHGFWVGGHVETKAAVSLVPFVNRYLFYTPSGKDARLSVKQDLVSTRAAGELVDKTSGLSKANHVAGVGIRVLGALSGLSTPGAIGKSKDYEFAVDNAAYPGVVAETLITAHELFLARLLEARDAAAED